MIKSCSICKKEKSFSEFNKNSSKKDGLQSHCRDCNKIKSVNYYSSNKEKHKAVILARHKKQSAALLQYTYNLLKNTGCIDCEENDPCCLDFDHMENKKECISKMIRGGCSLSTLLEEISKCEIRCANCHRKKTAKDFDWYRNINKNN